VDRLYLDLPLITDLMVLLVLVVATHFIGGLVDAPTGVFVLSLAVILARSSERSERLHIAALDDVGKMFRAGIFAYAAVSLLTSVVPQLGDVRASHQFLWVAGLSAPALVLGRSIHYAARRSAARRGMKTRTLMVGAGEVAQELISTLNEDAGYGLQVVGAVDDSARFDSDALGARLLGKLSELTSLTRAHGAEAVIVAFGGSNDVAQVAAVREVMSLDVDIWVVPRFFEMGGDMTGLDHIGSVPVVKIHARTQARRGWRMKRLVDILIASVGILMTGPLMALIAGAVKVGSVGPVIYRQERIGVGGRRIRILKFRTMADSSQDPTQDAAWTASADRVTKIGAFLRKSGLDELPQLFNVLRGDLTLVGPRPERPKYVEMFDAMYPHYAARHRVPSGITGWAQIHGLRGDTSIDERARFDNYYIENWSMWNDLKILMLTSRTLMTRYKGAIISPAETDNEPENKQTRD
jgi:exopolysaccharide biosynthesis polyprenyl glycosylphosphotransferase